ncbi:MAG: outer membrane beta-barrel protein [Campylobacterales bacterium]|nr:outer membrane beta-barrel protein [Campylobacterales bacterium]
MKKIASLMAIALSLSAYDGTSKSLAGVEFGYSQLEYNADDSVLGNGSDNESFGLVGLKIGAENEEARVFIDGHYYNAGGDFDYVNSVGAGLQYLLRATDSVNFFAGINGGLVNIKFSDDGIGRSYELSSAYYGGDLGMNIALQELLDWELGVRFMAINASNTQVYTDTLSGEKVGREYTMDHMLNFYTSLIFKFYVD